MAGLLGQIALAGFQSLAFDAPVEPLSGPLASTTALAAAGAIAVVAWACGRLVDAQLRPWLDTLALVAVAQFTGLALEGAALAAMLAARGARARRASPAATTIATPRGRRSASPRSACCTRSARWRRPDALFDGLDAPLAAAGALAAVAARAARGQPRAAAWPRTRRRYPRDRAPR